MEANESGSDPLRTQPLSQDLRAYVMRLMQKERNHPGGLPTNPEVPAAPQIEWRRSKFMPPSAEGG